MSDRYPYVIVRLAACVYCRREVEFCATPTPFEFWSRQPFRVHVAAPYEDGALTDEARRALIDEVAARVQAAALRMCAVFGPADAVYCEPDGGRQPSAQPPSGGIAARVVEDGAPPRGATAPAPPPARPRRPHGPSRRAGRR